MTTLILFLVLVAVTVPLAWLVRRRMERERRRAAFVAELSKFARAVDETARVIGEAFLPAMQQAAQALAAFAAAFSVPGVSTEGEPNG